MPAPFSGFGILSVFPDWDFSDRIRRGGYYRFYHPTSAFQFMLSIRFMIRVDVASSKTPGRPWSLTLVKGDSKSMPASMVPFCSKCMMIWLMKVIWAALRDPAKAEKLRDFFLIGAVFAGIRFYKWCLAKPPCYKHQYFKQRKTGSNLDPAIENVQLFC